MKNKNLAATSIIYLLPGTLLMELNGFYESIPSTIVATFGCLLLFKGYAKLNSAGDVQIKNSVSILNTSVYIVLASILIDIIPLLGIISSIGFIVGFVLQLYAFILLKKSTAIGEVGQRGVKLIILAMGLSFFAAMFNLIPFLGDTISSYVLVAVYILITLGWLKLFEDFIEVESKN